MSGGAQALAPGSVLGILGGGQLGRMTAHAAQRLGYRACVLCQDAEEPAAQVTNRVVLGAFDDPETLARFAAQVDVVTLEFENLPAASLDWLAQHRPVRPSAMVLRACQDRAAEKRAIQAAGVPVAPWRALNSAVALDELAAFPYPAILKTARLGYDGKGQRPVAGPTDLAAAWRALGALPCVLEQRIDFACEISVIGARGVDGAVACYPPARNEHDNHILATTTVPAPGIDPALAQQAVALAERLLHALEVVGLLAVEMFVTRDGALLVNELAPRPHNSGHWSLDAARCDQFAMLVRAAMGLPLGDPTPLTGAVMHNLLGVAADDLARYWQDGNARVHLYGKGAARAGRKMGHVTWLIAE